MIPKQNNWNIVLAGLWNRAIFTPEWVGRLLFNQSEVETLISIMPHMPIIYRNRQVSLEVSSSRLAFRPRTLNDECLIAAEIMAHKVLSTLQDTPLMGVGINFSFTESEPHRDLITLFEIADSVKLADDGWETEERRLARRIRKDGDILNLTLVLSGDKLDAEFNFHTETSENSVAQSAVENRVIRLRDTALRLLEKTYDLHTEREEISDG